MNNILPNQIKCLGTPVVIGLQELMGCYKSLLVYRADSANFGVS